VSAKLMTERIRRTIGATILCRCIFRYVT
jgi:hypothetical protein